VQLPADVFRFSGLLQIKLMSSDLVLFAHLGRCGRRFLTVPQAPSLGSRCQLTVLEEAASAVSRSRAVRFYHHLIVVTSAWWLTFNFDCKPSKAGYSDCLKHACSVHCQCSVLNSVFEECIPLRFDTRALERLYCGPLIYVALDNDLEVPLYKGFKCL